MLTDYLPSAQNNVSFILTPSPISLLALRSATYGYCPIDVPPDIVNKDWCSDFGEGIVILYS